MITFLKKNLGCIVIAILLGASVLPSIGGSNVKFILELDANSISTDDASLQNGDNPLVHITKPKAGYFYFFDREFFSTFRGNTIVVGKITVEAEFLNGDDINEVECYVDDVLLHTDTELSAWTLAIRTLGRHTIRVTVHDINGYIYSNESEVFILNMRSLITAQPRIIQPITETLVEDIVNIQVEEQTNIGDVDHCLFEYSIDGESWSEIADDINGEDGWSADWYTNDVDNWYYFIRSTLYDQNGVTGVDRVRVYVNNEPPLPIVNLLYYDPGTGYAAFDGSESVDPNGYVENWTWSFGDGHVAYGPTIEHIFDLTEYQGLCCVELRLRDDSYAFSYSHQLLDQFEGVLFEIDGDDLEDEGYEKVEGDNYEAYVEFDDTHDDEYDYLIHNSHNDRNIHDVEIQTKYTGNTNDIKVSGMGFGWRVEKEKNNNGEVKIRVVSGQATSKRKCQWLNIHLEIDFDNGANNAPPQLGKLRVSWNDGGVSRWVDIDTPGNPPD